MVTEHTVRSFSNELKALDQSIQEMGRLVISQIGDAMKAIVDLDLERASAVIQRDRSVDDLERAVDQMTVRLLALRQPVALDLRVIMAALRVSIDLERIADYAANIAKRVRDLKQAPMAKPMAEIVRMGDHARAMLDDVLRAYLTRDAELALQVWGRDDEIDRIYTGLLYTLRDSMAADQQAVTPCSHLLLVAKCMERMGDHITNIAEHIQFLVRGVSQRQMGGPAGASSEGE
ncbi:MAG: phosphate signaling complex protein PhoU [Syntrophobacteraceae bacterium]|nr:phosphate signaling complex protein PhoU [Syntrophobacteraceae bacterium]